ncbi:MAG: right-handed parallel beta-helix repeat-containing protein [Fidelibacterota bacterium]|nr:MAG: right-handed parallel beta-helix repeat-containing protein [Candidatus Neomarinimicrobiota bacterium]
MKQILTALIFISTATATIINVPADYSTVQAAINGATPGDTVLVQPGRYVENINFMGKNIVVGSHIITTQDTAYISQTVIDGNGMGSVVEFENGEDSTAVLCGMTILNGSAPERGDPEIGNILFPSGGGIFIIDSSPTLRDVHITENTAEGYGGRGGGIYLGNSSTVLMNVKIYGNSAKWGGGMVVLGGDPHLINVHIHDNTADDRGGGLYFQWGSSPFLESSLVNNNKSRYGGGICLNNSSPIFDLQKRCSIHSNHAGSGSELYIFGESPALLNVALDTFIVSQPTGHHAHPPGRFNFDIWHPMMAQVEADLYVSPAGDNSNNGLSPLAPLRSLSYALATLIADSLNPHTIFLSSGTYSPSLTHELIPLNLISWLSIIGDTDDVSILDGEGQGSVVFLDEDRGVDIRQLTITGGLSLLGGGMYVDRSTICIEDVTVEGNTANKGGGLLLAGSESSLNRITISGNYAPGEGIYSMGGGIFLNGGSASLTDFVISDNQGTGGGGIHIFGSDVEMTSGTFIHNSAGAAITCKYSDPILRGLDIRGNSGGIQFNYSHPHLAQVILANNSGTYGISFFESTAALVNTTISNNTGGGIHLERYCDVTLVNTILWANGPEEIHFHENPYPVAVRIYYSDILGGLPGINITSNAAVYWLDGNLDTDPLFADTSDGDYHLQPDSPCIDAGSPDSVYKDPEDPSNPGLALWPALGTTRSDMGAYGGNADNLAVPAFDDDQREEIELPAVFFLHPGYPNPFNASTTIRYDLRRGTRVVFTVYNLLGQEVTRLVDRHMEPGYHQVRWGGRDSNGRELPSGIYLARLVTQTHSKSIKMLLLK